MLILALFLLPLIMQSFIFFDSSLYSSLLIRNLNHHQFPRLNLFENKREDEKTTTTTTTTITSTPTSKPTITSVSFTINPNPILSIQPSLAISLIESLHPADSPSVFISKVGKDSICAPGLKVGDVLTHVSSTFGRDGSVVAVSGLEGIRRAVCCRDMSSEGLTIVVERDEEMKVLKRHENEVGKLIGNNADDDEWFEQCYVTNDEGGVMAVDDECEVFGEEENFQQDFLDHLYKDEVVVNNDEVLVGGAGEWGEVKGEASWDGGDTLDVARQKVMPQWSTDANSEEEEEENVHSPKTTPPWFTPPIVGN